MNDNLQPGLGTTLGISDDLPATEDEAGYTDAGVEFSTIGEITDIPEYGPNHDVVSHVPLATGITAKFHGAKNNGSLSVPVALDREDAGQILAKTALGNKARHSFLVTYPDGTEEYFQGKIFGFTRGASIGSVVMATVNLEIETDIVEVAPA